MINLIDWAFKGIIVILFVWGWFWLQRYFHEVDGWKKEAVTWQTNLLEVLNSHGGFLNRDKFFEFCKDCGARVLIDWRAKLSEKGGPITVLDHLDACNKNSLTLVAKIEEIMRLQTDSLCREIKDIKQTVLQNEQILREVEKIQQRVVVKLDIK